MELNKLSSEVAYLFFSWCIPYVYNDKWELKEYSDSASTEEWQVLPPIAHNWKAIPAPCEGAEKS